MLPIVVVCVALVFTSGCGLHAQESRDLVIVEFRLAEQEPGQGLIERTVGPDGRKVYVHPDAILTNADVADARVVANEFTGGFDIELSFTDAGSRRLAEATERHMGKPMAVLMDGVVVTAPMIQSRISERAIISGNYGREDANRLVRSILGER